MDADAPLFLEIDVAQRSKEGQAICGDAFVSHRLGEGQRVLSVLSDGLGSGIKANILSSMTATMALRFAASDMDFLHSAEVMMEALPICQVRKISYATFTVVDSVLNGWTRIIEMDNPGAMVVREGALVPLGPRTVRSPRWKDRTLLFSEVLTRPEDRIVLVSDGITQSGMGSWGAPLGWGETGCRDFVLRAVARSPGISARDLSAAVMDEGLSQEPSRRPGDDMTCVVMYFRRPRRLILLTGPPFARDRDREYARMLADFDGAKVVCGGTTAEIVARELNRPIETDLTSAGPGIPPRSSVPGVDLVTEGILTLTEARKLLETSHDPQDVNPAGDLARLLLSKDVIHFVVGTRINEAHQDPSLPVEIEIRRTIVKAVAAALKDRHHKEVSINYI